MPMSLAQFSRVKFVWLNRYPMPQPEALQTALADYYQEARAAADVARE